MPNPFELTSDDLAQASQQSHQQVSPQTSGLDELRPLPWWKRKLLAMQTQGAGPMPQQPAEGGGGSPVDQWSSLGRGANNLAMKLIGMEHGGAVQGPTMALIGEGGEPEYVVPESKIPSWVDQIQRTGAIPNPADLPRGDYMPPPPVILPPQVSDRNGTRPPPPVILPPRMAQGGVVYPRPVESVMPDPMDYFNAGDDMVGYNEPVAFDQAPLPPPPTARRPMPQMPMDKQRAYWEMQKNAPVPKWYERALGAGNENAGGGQLDMRPGVAGYSMAGRAAGNVLRGVLPFNRKRDEHNRNLAAARGEAQLEAAEGAQGQKQYSMGIEADQAESRVARDRAAQATSERQLEKLNAPPVPVDPHKGMRRVDKATGEAYGVMPEEDGSYWINSANMSRNRPAAPPAPRNPTRASLAEAAAKGDANAKAALELMDRKRGGGGERRENQTDAIARVTQRIIDESTQGGGKTMADAIRNVGKFYQGDAEVQRYRPEIVKRLQAEAKARGEVDPASDKDIEALKAVLGITGGGAPKSTPQASAAPQSTLSAGGRTYKVGDPVTVKGGKTVTITKINPDGTFEAN